MKSRLRNILVLAVKVLIAALLIGWLVRGGNLDVSALRIFFDQPRLLAADLGLFLFGTFLGTMRFRVLLGLAEVEVKLSKLYLLHMTSLFFNVVIPGNIGGDVVKVLYVARDEPAEKRTTILLLAFVERLLGVSALVLMGTLIMVLRGPALWSDPLLRPLAATVVGLGIATLFGGTAALLIVRRAGARLDRYTTGPSKISRLLNQLVASMRIVSADPGKLAIALVLSMLYHAGGIALFTILTQALVQKNVSYSAIATVFPLGLLSLLLPISPAGLGVGHVAFKRLFEQIGLSGGATVFNVYLLGQMAPCLLGVFPFLSLKRRGDLPSEASEAAPTEAAPPTT